MQAQNAEVEVQTQKQAVPDMGRHLVLDFAEVPLERFDLNSFDQVSTMLKDSLQLAGLQILNSSNKIFEPQGLTMLFVLDHGHLTIHTWPERQACAIDFYYCQFDDAVDTWQHLRRVEEHICDTLGWECCTSTVIVPRGHTWRVQHHDGARKSEVLQQVQFVYREQSPFNDIRIYETAEFGRVLWLNGYLQLTKQFLESPYREALCSPLVQNESVLTQLNSVVVLGGGDLLVVDLLLQRAPHIKRIVVVDIDKSVTHAVLKYFKFAQAYEEEIKSGRIELVYEDGAEWVKKALQNTDASQKFDAAVIDISSDALKDENALAAKITSTDFFKDLGALLNAERGVMCQNVYDKEQLEEYATRWQEAGFQKTEHAEIKVLDREHCFAYVWRA